MNKRETRTLPLKELRVSTLDNEKKFIEGHAAVFDSWSDLVPFKEKVRSGAFRASIENDDIRALFNHDPNYVLGRNKAGTLELAEDEQGLKVKIYPPDTQWARDLGKSIERGDINQMSFGFEVEEDEWRSENDFDVRELRKVKLFDVSAVTYPAYSSTDVGVRTMESYKEYRDALKQRKDIEIQNKEKEIHSKLDLLKRKLKI